LRDGNEPCIAKAERPLQACLEKDELIWLYRAKPANERAKLVRVHGGIAKAERPLQACDRTRRQIYFLIINNF